MVWTAGHTLRLVSWTLEALKFHAFFRASRKLFPLYMSVYAKNTNSIGIFQQMWSTAIFRKNEAGPYLTRICCQKWFNDETMGPQIAVCVWVCVVKVWFSISCVANVILDLDRVPNILTSSQLIFETFWIFWDWKFAYPRRIELVTHFVMSGLLSSNLMYISIVCVCVFSILKKYLSVCETCETKVSNELSWFAVCSSLNLTISPTRWRRYREGMELFSNELSWVCAVCSL